MFGNKKEKEEDLRLKVVKWWRDLKYFKKLEILLAQGTKPDGYPEHDITNLEYVGIRVFWNYNSLEKKALIMDQYEKERSEGRR